MCGIAGIIKANYSEREAGFVHAMCKKLHHRGPDASGVKQLPGAILGHTRLSIIDLSSNGAQPMSTLDGRYHITYNGEIYNFPEIKTELLKKNIRFFSNSDTEVLLQAYIHYGADCLHLLNGMFAFAIWDNETRKCFIARDRFGKKPFYYHYAKDEFSFASEVPALLENKQIPQVISQEALNCYLALGYILAPLSIYEHIKKLEAGHYLILENEKISKHRYWNFAEKFLPKNKQSPETIQREIIHLLTKAVERRLISDVPVGAFLSGGVDSSSIVALMKKFKKNELHTFSVGFEHEHYNELDDATKTANLLGTIHHGLTIGDENIQAKIIEALSAYHEPFADNSLIPMVEVSRLASQYVKVVLSGDGADEMFGGYETYKADKYYNYFRWMPGSVKKMLSSENLPNYFSSKKKINLGYKAKQFFYGTRFDYRKAHYAWRLHFRPEERVQIMGAQYKELVYDTDPFKTFSKYYDEVKGLEQLDQHLYVDCMTWLPDDILVKVDRASMHSSIEARAPYLDYDLICYAAALPAEFKLNGFKTKFILKEALKEILPAFVLQKKKSGFNAPFGLWLHSENGDEFKAFNRFALKHTISDKTSQAV
ncbi:MAG: asparagine synthase (glutamine-hydrolyzing) [Chitinophagales bacterium]|nr:asparagine synthase (glutamine-hydrolyzing) [Chitinophagales bacterium]